MWEKFRCRASEVNESDRQEREKLKEEKKKYAERLKLWNKPREDMECEDLKVSERTAVFTGGEVAFKGSSLTECPTSKYSKYSE